MKYNIVIINPDQLRGDYITPNGHPFIRTQHLSRMAERGTKFYTGLYRLPDVRSESCIGRDGSLSIRAWGS